MSEVAIYHNIVWPKYKGAVFSALHELAQAQGLRIAFVQIAETDGERAALGGVDLRYHRYPFELLFPGGYDAVPRTRLAWTLLRHVLRNPARVVVLPGYHRPEYWAMLLACMLSGKRRAVFCDSTAYDRPGSALKARLKRAFFSRCDAFLAYGRRSAEYLQQLGAPAGRIFQPCQAAALPPGFDAARALERRVAARAVDPAPRFLYVGRLAPEKDLPTLLQALRSLRATLPEASLVLVGAGPERAALEALARDLGLADAVHFAGTMEPEALAGEFARALALVLPSTSEPWGLVVNEALHHGCPVIVSEVCGCRPELVADGATGFAFPAGDAAALAQAMARAAQALADAAAVGAACQRHMAAYTPRQAAERLLAGCRSLLGQPAMEPAR